MAQQTQWTWKVARNCTYVTVTDDTGLNRATFRRYPHTDIWYKIPRLGKVPFTVQSEEFLRVKPRTGGVTGRRSMGKQWATFGFYVEPELYESLKAAGHQVVKTFLLDLLERSGPGRAPKIPRQSNTRLYSVCCSKENVERLRKLNRENRGWMIDQLKKAFFQHAS